MNTANLVGTISAAGASLSDLASPPRNALDLAGKASQVVQGLGYFGGAAATIAGLTMTASGIHKARTAKAAETRRDGAYTAIGGAAYTALGASFIAAFAGQAMANPAMGATGLATGLALGIRTGYRIAESYRFRERFAEARQLDDVEFANFLRAELVQPENFYRIVGDEHQTKIEDYVVKGKGTREEIEKLIDKGSFANFMLNCLVALLLVVWTAAMIALLVTPNAHLVNYLFMIPSAIWLINDSKGVPVLRYVNLGFAKMMHGVLAVKNALQKRKDYHPLSTTPDEPEPARVSQEEISQQEISARELAAKLDFPLPPA